MGFRFIAELGPLPPVPSVEAARRYHIKIMELLDRDDALPPRHPDRWTRSERAYLTMLYRVWWARSMGQDRRWALVGSYHGKLRRDLELEVNPKAARESLAWRRALDGGKP